jgi:hypothetical protein
MAKSDSCVKIQKRPSDIAGTVISATSEDLIPAPRIRSDAAQSFGKRKSDSARSAGDDSCAAAQFDHVNGPNKCVLKKSAATQQDCSK